MADHMRASLVCDALAMAIELRRPAPGLILHSDRGSQYTSREIRVLLEAHGAVQSLSRPRQCWDSAVAESFFATLKEGRRNPGETQAAWSTCPSNRGKATRLRHVSAILYIADERPIVIVWRFGGCWTLRVVPIRGSRIVPMERYQMPHPWQTLITIIMTAMLIVSCGGSVGPSLSASSEGGPPGSLSILPATTDAAACSGDIATINATMRAIDHYSGHADLVLSSPTSDPTASVVPFPVTMDLARSLIGAV